MLPAAFCDEAVIEVCGGRGGRGKVSFLRTRSRPRGGPDGGSGGGGGNVVAQVDPNLATLAEYVRQRRWQAPDGVGGGSVRCHGANGRELVLAVPPGTDIYDHETGDLHASLLGAGERTVLARGGYGGRGNATFRSSANRAPREAGPGEPGELRSVRLELRLLADIGLVGLPNAGKSSLLVALTAARPAIAPYPFTTLRPHLGTVACGELGLERMVVADLPGIIAGAAGGAGLGLRFLRHIGRARVLLHVVDASSGDRTAILDAVGTVEAEMAAAGAAAGKQRMLALSKADMLDADTARDLAAAVGEAAGLPAAAVSSQEKTGLSELAAAMEAMLPVGAGAHP